jgi:hypothetical protein
VLRDVSARSQTIELFGARYAAPFGIAPMGLAALTAYDGDRVLARAAAKAGIPFVLSATSLTPLEKVIEAAPGSWFQAYLPGEDARIVALDTQRSSLRSICRLPETERTIFVPAFRRRCDRAFGSRGTGWSGRDGLSGRCFERS